VLRPRTWAAFRLSLPSLVEQADLELVTCHILPIRCRDTVTLPTVLCISHFDIYVGMYLDRVAPSQEGVYAMGEDRLPATCQLLRGYLERLHETRCVAGPVSQLSTDPFATVPTGVQEEIRASSLRIPADSNSDRMPHNHQRKTSLVHGVLGASAFVHSQRRDGHALICQQWAATPETPGLSPVQRPSNRLPHAPLAGPRLLASASAVSRTPTAYSSAATSRQTTAKPAGCMPPPNSLVGLLF